jgi:hypothetical protein
MVSAVVFDLMGIIAVKVILVDANNDRNGKVATDTNNSV